MSRQQDLARPRPADMAAARPGGSWRHQDRTPGGDVSQGSALWAAPGPLKRPGHASSTGAAGPTTRTRSAPNCGSAMGSDPGQRPHGADHRPPGRPAASDRPRGRQSPRAPPRGRPAKVHPDPLASVQQPSRHRMRRSQRVAAASGGRSNSRQHSQRLTADPLFVPQPIGELRTSRDSL